MKLRELLSLVEGVDDPVQPTLSVEYFDKKEKLHPHIITFIKKKIDDFNVLIAAAGQPAQLTIKDAIFVGARATFQYSDDSDGDVNLCIKPINGEKSVSSIVSKAVSNIVNKSSPKSNGTFKIGSLELQFKATNSSKGTWATTHTFDNVYDLYTNGWLKFHDHAETVAAFEKTSEVRPSLLNKYATTRNKFMGMSARLVIELKELKKSGNGPYLIPNDKENGISFTLTQLADIVSPIYTARSKAFTVTPEEAEKYLTTHSLPSLNWTKENREYKLMSGDIGDIINANWTIISLIQNDSPVGGDAIDTLIAAIEKTKKDMKTL